MVCFPAKSFLDARAWAATRDLDCRLWSIRAVEPESGASLEALSHCRATGRLRAHTLLAGIADAVQKIASPSPNLLAASATIDGLAILILAQDRQAGATHAAESLLPASAFWFARDQIAQAAQRGWGVLTVIDTPGADPVTQAREHRLPWSISACIRALLAYPGPTVSLILGEATSGGALALQVADERLMLSDALFPATSPESCSAILYRDTHHLTEALALLRPSADDVLRSHVIDTLCTPPAQSMTQDPLRAIAHLRDAVHHAFQQAQRIPAATRTARRVTRYARCGKILTAPPAAQTQALVATPIDAPESCNPATGGCGQRIDPHAFIAAGWACPNCQRGTRLRPAHWYQLICGAEPFEEHWPQLDLQHLDHGGYDNDAYRVSRHQAQRTTHAFESLRIGFGAIGSQRCALALSDFAFFGGTLSAVAGEKLQHISVLAQAQRCPLIAVVTSGGVRMQEGTLGLAQMIKAVAAVQSVIDAGLPYIAVLADPCTGGALAGYASAAPVVLAEPHTLISFSGPRVMRLAGFQVDEASLRAESLLPYGGITRIVPRPLLSASLQQILSPA